MNSIIVEKLNGSLRTLLNIKKLKHCYECGICTARCPIVELIPKHYNPRHLLEKIYLDLEKMLREKEIWLCAWCYRCNKRCPQGLRLPEIFQSLRKLAIEKGHLQGFKEAQGIIKREIPLSVVCSWLCFHPERAQVDRQMINSTLPLDYEALSTFKPDGKRVAIIGSGPAGLTAAYDLNRMGHLVTIFESMSQLGGMLRKCIPKYRLPKDVLDAEIERIKRLGVRFRTNVTIGKDLTINDLLQDGYKAIFIATGAHGIRNLHIEGEKLKGVVYALDFLKNVNLGKIIKLGSRVVVIGGGNVAIDVAGTALRLGVATVQLACLESRGEMPAYEWEIQEALMEGLNINPSWGLKRVLGDGNKVIGVEFVRCVSVFDENGVFNPSFDETITKTLNVDTVILAIGQAPDLSFLPDKVKVRDTGTITVNPFTMETSLTGVFAGGDVVSGPATVIETIVASRRAAVFIDHYLECEDPGTGSKIYVGGNRSG